MLGQMKGEEAEDLGKHQLSGSDTECWFWIFAV